MQIEWTAKAIKDLRRLARNDRERIIAKVESYASNPASLDNQVKQLSGSELRRLRVGNYRIIFLPETPENSVVTIMVVLRIRHRKEACE